MYIFEGRRPRTEKERKVLRFIRKHLLPGPNQLQLDWGATAAVRLTTDGGIRIISSDRVTPEHIYWHLRQQVAKAERAVSKERRTNPKPTWDPSRRELRMTSHLAKDWKRPRNRTTSQLAILDAAQRVGWRRSFPNPYNRPDLQTADNPKGYDEEMARDRVHDLNDRLTQLGFSIHFSASFDLIRVSFRRIKNDGKATRKSAAI